MGVYTGTGEQTPVFDSRDHMRDFVSGQPKVEKPVAEVNQNPDVSVSADAAREVINLGTAPEAPEHVDKAGAIHQGSYKDGGTMAIDFRPAERPNEVK